MRSTNAARARALLVAAVLWLGAAGRADAAIAVAHHTVNSVNTNGVTVAVTVTSTTGGNLLIVGTANEGGRTVSSVTDNKGGGSNTYVQATSAASAGTAGNTDLWYCLNAGGGVTSVTITYSGAAGTFFKIGWVWEVSGFTTAAFDVANNLGNGSGSGTDDTGAAVTTTSTTGFVAAVLESASGVQVNPKAGNEFSSGGDIDSNTLAASASLISATAATHTPVWTDFGSNQFITGSTAAFKESGGGGATPKRLPLLGVGDAR